MDRGLPVLRSAPNAAAYALELLIIGAAYLGLAATELLLPSLNPTATPLWPPTAFALALLLLSGYRVWPAILVGSFSFGAMVSHAFLAPGVTAVGTVLAGLAGAWLTNKWSNGRKTFDTPLGVAKFALIVVAPTAMVGSAVATGSAVLGEDIDAANPAGWLSSWASWWVADAGGGLVIAPAVMLWALTPLRPLARRSVLETAAIFLLATAIGFLAFGQDRRQAPGRTVRGLRRVRRVAIEARHARVGKALADHRLDPLRARAQAFQLGRRARRAAQRRQLGVAGTVRSGVVFASHGLSILRCAQFTKQAFDREGAIL